MVKHCQGIPISPQDAIERIGFNLNASRERWMTGVTVGRIQDKTRWTKALGEAVTVVYGDWNEGSEPNKHCRGGDRVTRGLHSN